MAAKKKSKALTYRDSGVDIEAADDFVDRIGPLAKSTRRPEVLGAVGGFGSLVGLPEGYKDPVLVAGADGVGTKLKLAFELDRHGTIGIDLVAMNVNDVVVQGAEPLFFLDYLATSHLDPKQATEVIKGIAKGCKQAGCALVGGETAEMPGFYERGEYDLAGFCVGVVERKKILDGSKVRPGDVVIGFASTGVHSNGFSLVRKILEARKIALTDSVGGSKKPIGQRLLEPTRIYVPLALKLLRKTKVHAFAHITGGGLPGNLPRILPDGTRVVIDRRAWPRPKLFQILQDAGSVADEEMLRTFNWGVGFCTVVPQESVTKVKGVAQAQRIVAWEIGTIEKRSKGQGDFEIRW